MRPITDLVKLVDEQFDVVGWFSEVDGYYADQPPRSWKQLRPGRRGWTRRDKIWHDQAAVIANAKPWKMPLLKSNDRRLQTGFRVLKKWRRDLVIDALKNALDFCKGKPHFAAIEPMLVRMVEHHLLWLEWMREQDYSDAQSKRAETRLELSGALAILESIHAQEDDDIEFALTSTGNARLLPIYKELRRNKGRYVTLDQLVELYSDEVSYASVAKYIRVLNTFILSFRQEIDSPRADSRPGEKKFLLRSISDTGVRE